MDKKVIALLNQQVNKEFFSAYLYLSFANYFENRGLSGFANWYLIQAQEERDHAMLFVKFLQNNDESLIYEAIEKPASTWENEMEVLKAGLAHEKFITDSINKIYATALDLKDFRTTQFLDWFIKEQGEEETNANELIQQAELIGKSGNGLYMLDQKLALRVYAAPSLVL
ncbi:MAG: ferritin [Sphaerochaetaceae bacterium]|nr:ferritin [Candidatus Nanoarchaeia archaeon]